jgi:large subunit ribosomal protein L6
MSRIGKKPVPVPAGVKVAIQDRTVRVDGPKGKLSFTHVPNVKVTHSEADKALVISLAPGYKAETQGTSAFWGTTRAVLRNMVEGVEKGFEKSLEVVGVGWTASLQGKQLKVVAGYANPILVKIPDALTVTVDKQFIKIAGSDRQAVGQFASALRARRKPEPYNGKGIKYVGETIRRKQGKQFGA